jgi:HEAT repeat protein
MALVRPKLEPAAPAASSSLPTLDAASAAARRQAARSRAADPNAADALAARLAIESDDSVREALLAALGTIGTAEAVAHLFALLDSEDVWLRNAAIETLQGMDAAVLDALKRSLDHPDSDHRIFAVNVLTSLRHPAAADLALRALDRDAHVNVCAAALDVLAEIGRPEMAPAIAGAVERFPDEPFLRFAAKAALRRIA